MCGRAVMLLVFLSVYDNNYDGIYGFVYRTEKCFGESLADLVTDVTKDNCFIQCLYKINKNENKYTHIVYHGATKNCHCTTTASATRINDTCDVMKVDGVINEAWVGMVKPSLNHKISIGTSNKYFIYSTIDAVSKPNLIVFAFDDLKNPTKLSRRFYVNSLRDTRNKPFKVKSTVSAETGNIIRLERELPKNHFYRYSVFYSVGDFGMPPGKVYITSVVKTNEFAVINILPKDIVQSADNCKLLPHSSFHTTGINEIETRAEIKRVQPCTRDIKDVQFLVYFQYGTVPLPLNSFWRSHPTESYVTGPQSTHVTTTAFTSRQQTLRLRFSYEPDGFNYRKAFVYNYYWKDMINGVEEKRIMVDYFRTFPTHLPIKVFVLRWEGAGKCIRRLRDSYQLFSKFCVKFSYIGNKLIDHTGRCIDIRKDDGRLIHVPCKNVTSLPMSQLTPSIITYLINQTNQYIHVDNKTHDIFTKLWVDYGVKYNIREQEKNETFNLTVTEDIKWSVLCQASLSEHTGTCAVGDTKDDQYLIIRVLKFMWVVTHTDQGKKFIGNDKWGNMVRVNTLTGQQLVTNPKRKDQFLSNTSPLSHHNNLNDDRAISQQQGKLRIITHE